MAPHPRGFASQYLPGPRGREGRQGLAPVAVRARQLQRLGERGGDAGVPGGVRVKPVVAPEPGIGRDGRVRGEIHQPGTGRGAHAADARVHRPDAGSDRPCHGEERGEVGQREGEHDRTGGDARLLHPAHVVQDPVEIEPRLDDVVGSREARDEVGLERQCGRELPVPDLPRGAAPFAEVRVVEISLLREPCGEPAGPADPAAARGGIVDPLGRTVADGDIAAEAHGHSLHAANTSRWRTALAAAGGRDIHDPAYNRPPPLAPQESPAMTDRDRLHIAHEALDDWLDRRFERGAPLEPLLETLRAASLDAAGVEALLRNGRLRYPGPSHAPGSLSAPMDLDCDHVDHRVRYMVYLPRAYDPGRAWPLVVIGHGGSATRDMVFAARAARDGMEPSWCEASEAYGLVLLAPLTDRGWGAIGNSILFSAISRATRDYHVDPDRIHVTGHSMGGHLAWRCGINFADRWGAISPMSGGYDYVRDRQVESLANVPGYATWGSHEPFRIAEYNRAIRAYMEANAYRWVHSECPGGHEIFPREIPRVARFFLDHRRNLYRTTVRARGGGPLEFNAAETHPEWGRAHTWRAGRPIPVSTFHWLRLDPLPPGTPPDQAVQRVDAVHRDGNAFEIASVNARRMRIHVHPCMVDFAQDVTVTVNGARLFTGRVRPDLGTLLGLVREFDDRGRVFHAAIDIEVPEPLRRGPPLA